MLSLAPHQKLLKRPRGSHHIAERLLLLRVAQRMSGEDPRAVYEAAVRAVFSRWTLLQLAVDQGWSDGDGRLIASELLERLLALVLADKKVYQDEVEDLLFDVIEAKVVARSFSLSRRSSMLWPRTEASKK